MDTREHLFDRLWLRRRIPVDNHSDRRPDPSRPRRQNAPTRKRRVVGVQQKALTIPRHVIERHARTAIEATRVKYFVWNTGFEVCVIVGRYTHRPDGRRIESGVEEFAAVAAPVRIDASRN